MTTSFEHDTSELAATYHRMSDWQVEGGQRLIERLAVGPGARVLDLGCGTGRLTRWIAERVGPDGCVVGVDPLAERIAIARAQSPNVAFHVGQAEDLGVFEEATFDAVCMSAVFHWVEDKPRALREVRRVLRPGGRFGLTTPTRDLIGASTVASVLVPVLTGPDYAAHADLSKLALASRGPTLTDLILLVTGSGLELVELYVRERRRTHASGVDAVDFFEASSFGNFLRIVPEELRAKLRADVATGFEAHRGPDGVVLRDWGTLLVAACPSAGALDRCG